MQHQILEARLGVIEFCLPRKIMSLLPIFYAGWRFLAAALLCCANVGAQSGSIGVERGSPQERTLIVRYDSATSMFRLIEDFQILRGPNATKYESNLIAVRLCSNEPLLKSIPLAAVNPVEFVDFITNIGGYKKSNIVFLRHPGCSVPSNNTYATEFWSAASRASLPSFVENYPLDKVQLSSIGFDPVNCVVPNPKILAKQLVTALERDHGAFATVIRYYLTKPTPELVNRTNFIKRALASSNISASRYKFATQSWHDGTSGCSEKEPTIPMVIMVSVSK
jgi:hypothetical protein